jgi:hypothetical protein
MKTTRSPRTMFISISGIAAFLAFAAAPFDIAIAQEDSAFLACAEHSDRAQRIACLEDALEAAQPSPAAPVAQPVAPRNPAVGVTPPPAPVPPSAPAVTGVEQTPAPTAATPENDPSLLDRLRNFGKHEAASPSAEASLSTNADGQEQLHDTIAKLEKRNNLWIVTLASGQVWKQEFPRTLNLREGDQISIYQAGIGNGYRLATARLSGFIRVERAQ